MVVFSMFYQRLLVWGRLKTEANFVGPSLSRTNLIMRE